MPTSSQPTAPPLSVCDYIEDMLVELGRLARSIGEVELAPHIEATAALAHQATLRYRRDRGDDAA